MKLLTVPSLFGGRLLGITPQRMALFALLLIVVAALTLRLYGISWDEGYPYTPHPDERAILQHVESISPPAVGDLSQLFDSEESSWNPNWFPYGSLPLYLLKGVEVVYEGASGRSLDDLRLIGRVISSLADVITLVTTYLLAARFFGRRVGIASAGLIAIAVIHIQLSHFYTVDTLLTMFAVLSLFFLYRVATGGKWQDSVLAGLFVGLGLATKTSLLPILIAFGAAHFIYLYQFVSVHKTQTRTIFTERLKGVIQGLLFGLGIAMVAFFVSQPYAILDWQHFFADWTEQSEMVRRIRDYPYTRQYVGTVPFWYQMRQIATWGLGWPLGVAVWMSLAFVTLRGMSRQATALYVVFGLLFPSALLIIFDTGLCLVLAGIVAGVSIVATLPVRKPESRLDVLMLSWVVPYFVIIGSFEVKFMRYMLPVIPFMLLLVARTGFVLWGNLGKDLRPRLGENLPFWSKGFAITGNDLPRRVLTVLVIGTVVFTVFYAVAYIGVYSKVHPAVRAASWLKSNAQPDAIVLKEHWEESLPGPDQFQWRELLMYEPDSRFKFSKITQQLAAADFLVFYSHRMYGNLPRLSERYPASTEYYNLLFSGRLGYELVEFETSYPRLWGISFIDDTFKRPNIPIPRGLENHRPSPVTINLGFADESFTVYDHPKVLIFRNVERFDSLTIFGLIETAIDGSFQRVDQQRLGPVYTLEEARVQQAGGTWRDIFPEDSWTNRLPVLSWLIVVEGLGLLALPLIMVVFRGLHDRGYLLSKVSGLLIVGLIVWWLASLKWMAFSPNSIAMASVTLAVMSGIVLVKYRDELLEFLRKHWRIMLVGEVIFLVAFFSFVAIRMANPDLWHPFRGGEKPMELAYLNAVVRSTYMPPYDPWYAGGYLNYYYWGHFLNAMIMKATGIEIRYAFNLAVPMFFALSVVGAFSVVYNLAAASGNGRGNRGRSISKHAMGLSPMFAGLAGAAFVAVLGNLDGAIQIGHSVKRMLFYGKPFGLFDFWKSSRMMPPDPPGHEITEFPFFTFLFADLHPHLMVLPFTLLAVGLALALVLGNQHGFREMHKGLFSKETATEWLLLLGLGLAVGSLAAINTWDYPTYLILASFAVLLRAFFVVGGIGLKMLLGVGVKVVLLLAISYIAFLPYHLNFETSISSLEATTNRTVLWQFLAIFGLFVFIIGSFFLHEMRDWYMIGWRHLQRWLFNTSSGLDTPSTSVRVYRGMSLHPVNILRISAAVLTLSGVGYVIATYISLPLGSTLPFLALLLLIVVAAGIRWMFADRLDAKPLAFVSLMAGLAFGLSLGLELYRVDGDIDRMNSVFKIYLQVWVLLGVVAAYALWRLAGRIPWGKLSNMNAGAWAWMVFTAIMILSAGVYTVQGTQDRLRDRFDNHVTPMTLDGMEFIHDAVFVDEKGPVPLTDDYEGILWMQQNLEGSPVILEAHTGTYRWGNRITNYTGLPAVVGWKWHQEQQRWGYSDQIQRRISDVAMFYRTDDPRVALGIIHNYNVQYVYVSTLERRYYPEEGLAKFERMGSTLERVCCETGPATIYRVRSGATDIAAQ